MRVEAFHGAELFLMSFLTISEWTSFKPAVTRQLLSCGLCSESKDWLIWPMTKSFLTKIVFFVSVFFQFFVFFLSVSVNFWGCFATDITYLLSHVHPVRSSRWCLFWTGSSVAGLKGAPFGNVAFSSCSCHVESVYSPSRSTRGTFPPAILMFTFFCCSGTVSGVELPFEFRATGLLHNFPFHPNWLRVITCHM